MEIAGAKATPTLQVRLERLDETEQQRWRHGDRSLLAGCSAPLKQILKRKACARPGTRFFGEAYVSAMSGGNGWYGSFKWLTSPKWCGERKLADSYQAEFRAALLQHFPRLSEFQEMVRASTRAGCERSPVGPDLWLIEEDRHRFIEVKRPGDSVAAHQLLGLALIATLLRGDRPISVEVVGLYSGASAPNVNELHTRFQRLCGRLMR
jgi:hypothetical protein